MRIVGMNLEYIKTLCRVEGDYYIFELGDKFEVTSRKRTHKNNILAKLTDDEVKDDKLMIKYTPNRRIYFDKDLMEGDSLDVGVSCSTNIKSNRVYVGKYSKYEIKRGLLAFTGMLSANNMLEEEHTLYVSKTLPRDTVFGKVRLLGAGLLQPSDVLGVWLVPCERGFYFKQGSGNLKRGISSKTYSSVGCSNVNCFTLDDWFEGCSLKAVESEV